MVKPIPGMMPPPIRRRGPSVPDAQATSVDLLTEILVELREIRALLGAQGPVSDPVIHAMLDEIRQTLKSASGRML